jgi:hypothetical protein
MGVLWTNKPTKVDGKFPPPQLWGTIVALVYKDMNWKDNEEFLSEFGKRL